MKPAGFVINGGVAPLRSVLGLAVVRLFKPILTAQPRATEGLVIAGEQRWNRVLKDTELHSNLFYKTQTKEVQENKEIYCMEKMKAAIETLMIWPEASRASQLSKHNCKYDRFGPNGKVTDYHKRAWYAPYTFS